MPKWTKGDYALLYANGMRFSDVYDLMRADIIEELMHDELDGHIGCPPGCTSPVCSCPGSE